MGQERVATGGSGMAQRTTENPVVWPAARWRPAPAVRLSIASHIAGLAAVAVWPSGGSSAWSSAWPWVATFLASHHAAFLAASFVPSSTLIGANASRLPRKAAARSEIALTFDDGPDPEVTPRVLDLLDAAGMRGTFFCIGTSVARYPALAREITVRGHAVENHTQDHSSCFGFFSVTRYRSEIAAAQRVIAEVTGSVPGFFRAPFGIRNPFLDPAVQSLQLQYVSWTRRGLDTLDHDAARVHQRLTARLAAGDILLMHDGAHGYERQQRATVLDALPQVIASVQRAGLRAVTLAEAWRA